MSRSKPRKPAAGGAGKRLQTIGLFLTLLLVAVLVGSLAAGLMSGRRDSSAEADAPAAKADPPAARKAGARPGERVRVEVLNASGVSGLAGEGRTLLRDAGYDVVSVGNAPGEFTPDSSAVLDRVGRMELARSVADEMEIRRVYARPDSNLYVDVTVVLGRDWAAAHAIGADPPTP